MSVAASEDIAFIDRVLESWAAWARNAGMPVYSHTSLRYSSGRDSLPSVLRLSDEKFARVDRAVAHLHADSRAIIHVHYCRHENESKVKKAERCSMSLRHYKAALAQAQLDVFESLVPDIYSWE